MARKSPSPTPKTKSAGREAKVLRHTRETQIELRLALDGAGAFRGSSGLPFLDHMLTLLARHAGWDLALEAGGDLPVDCHHMVEDLGIVLGQALREAAGGKAGIQRYGQAAIPMEETLVNAALDFCGRPYLHWGIPLLDRELIGDYATEMTEDFFRAVAMNSGLTVHFDLVRGRNAHHIIEAAFKAFARAMRQALSADPHARGAIPSTKGAL